MRLKVSEFDIREIDDEEEYEDLYEYADIRAIQEEYRRKKLIESLIGPVISTFFHGAYCCLAILITDKYKEEVSEIEVTMTDVEEVVIEEPPPVEEPEPRKLKQKILLIR